MALVGVFSVIINFSFCINREEEVVYLLDEVLIAYAGHFCLGAESDASKPECKTLVLSVRSLEFRIHLARDCGKSQRRKDYIYDLFHTSNRLKLICRNDAGIICTDF